MKPKKATALGQQLVRYGIGAGAASLAASAQADIQYSGPLSVSGNQIAFSLQNFSTTVGTSPTADFQLDSKPSKLKAGVSAQSGGAPGAGVAFDLAQGQFSPATQYALRLGSGSTIGSNLGFSGQNYSFFNNYYPGFMTTPPGAGNGNWKPGDEGFLGLTITIGGNTVYGWADVTLNNLNGNSPGVFTLHGLAYEDSGAAIQAGAVPEPSAIALLVAGAAGVLALKRRKAKS
jgi:PEP-CTERM motif-containing protein